jgi:hypothetical protein
MNTTSGGALTGGLMDGIGSLFTIGAQKRAATKAYQRQKEFWNMQNAYNTPKAQMERLKAAGLNPALMYGQGNTGNAMQLSGVSKADVQGPALAQSAAAGAQISLTNAARKKMQAEADNLRASASLSNEMAQQTIANTLKISADKSKVIQETLNLKTQGEILDFEKAIKELEAVRSKKGILKGDTIGNILSILNLDPINNPKDRQLLQIALGAYFGANVASTLINSIVKIPFSKGGR